MTHLQMAVGVAETGIRRAMVIGAGSMGSGIAAQFANAGVPVDLLDVTVEAAQAGIDRQLTAGGFMTAAAARLIRPGSTRTDLDRAGDADWIVEVIIEDLAAKRDLFQRIEPYRRAGTLVTSNTSTLRLSDLVRDLDPALARDFAITHFFNPPRSMPLVEVVTGPDTAGVSAQMVRTGAETILGKTVVECFDTPGFIANRIGCYWIAVGILEAMRLGLTIEEAEAVNMAFGVPKSGVFGCLDIVGLDLVPAVWGSLKASLPASDDLHRFDLTQDTLIATMVAEGRKGRKTRQGFTRPAAGGGFETTDLVTGAYRPAQPVAVKDLPGGGRDLVALFEAEGKLGAYARSLLVNLVAYAATHGPEIAAEVGAVDLALQLGYGWKEGPFRLADRLGLDRIAKALDHPVPLLDQARALGGFHAAAGALSTHAPRHVVSALATPSLLDTAKAGGGRIIGNDMADLWNLGDGVACFEAKSKMNCFDPGVFDLLAEVLAKGPGLFQALVLGNDHNRAFSVGADLGFISGMIASGGLGAVDRYVDRGQRLFLAMKRAAFPVVAAAHGFALGGGCEFMLHADAVVAHAELTVALPEVKVGLVPAWGGCTQLLLRSQHSGAAKGPVATARTVFATLLSGDFSTSAADARAKGYLRASDAIVMSRAALLPAAKACALALMPGYHPPAPALIQVAGPSGKAGLMVEITGKAAAGGLTPTDISMAEMLAEVLTGGPSGDVTRPLDEAAMMALEREALIELARRPSTRARIDHMLATGKPLRN